MSGSSLTDVDVRLKPDRRELLSCRGNTALFDPRARRIGRSALPIVRTRLVWRNGPGITWMKTNRPDHLARGLARSFVEGIRRDVHESMPSRLAELPVCGARFDVGDR